MPFKELRPVKESSAHYEHIERLILAAFKRDVFLPLLKRLKLSPRALQNAAGDPLQPLYDALRSGKVRYDAGRFTGSFSAAISRALRAVGGKWDAKLKGFRLPDTRITAELRQAIAVSETAFQATLADIDERLKKILPEKITDNLKLSATLDDLLWKTGKNIDSTLKGITVSADLTPERRKRIADEWENNLKLDIKKFAADEIKSLRKRIEQNVFSGNRYEAVVAEIQRSYGVTAAKAKFLASQETRLLLAKYKETRYAESGVTKYKWRCVVGSPNHPVRPSHKALENRVFDWSNPPVTTAANEPARRNNPGEDFNCRCFALPIVEF